MTVTEKARGRDENVHAIEYAPATHHVEAVQQEGLEEPSVLRLAAREHAVDRSPKRAGHSCAVGGGMRKEIRGVAQDRKAHPLDVAYLAVDIGERGQVCAMSEFPINLGNREAVVLEKAGALFHRAGKKRHIARRVVERLGVCAAAVGHVDHQCAVASTICRHDENDLR